MDNRHSGSLVRDGAAQLPDRHRWHHQDLAGGRLCSLGADGFDGNFLCCRGLTNSDSYCYCNSYGYIYSHADRDTHTDSNTNSYSSSYCHAYGHANTDAYADSHSYGNGYCNRNSNSDRNAHADGNINPMYGEVFTDTEASANSSAPSVVAGRADLAPR
jgi:hypothetical protein